MFASSSRLASPRSLVSFWAKAVAVSKRNVSRCLAVTNLPRLRSGAGFPLNAPLMTDFRVHIELLRPVKAQAPRGVWSRTTHLLSVAADFFFTAEIGYVWSALWERASIWNSATALDFVCPGTHNLKLVTRSRKLSPHDHPSVSLRQSRSHQWRITRHRRCDGPHVCRRWRARGLQLSKVQS